MVKVILADDQRSYSDALKYTLERSGEMEVVACASDGREAYELCKTHHPDIVLMDLVMPLCDGIEGTSLIKAFDKTIKVLVLTTFSDDVDISRALHQGADGYLLKEMETGEIISAIKSVIGGVGIIHSNILKKVSEMLVQPSKSENGAVAAEAGLNGKEIEVIKLVVDGLSNKEIAEKLYYTEGTVKNMITIILAKVSAKDRTQLAVFAIKNRLV